MNQEFKTAAKTDNAHIQYRFDIGVVEIKTTYTFDDKRTVVTSFLPKNVVELIAKDFKKYFEELLHDVPEPELEAQREAV